MNAEPLRVAVVTGGHHFDVINFHRLFRSLKDVDAYIQHMDDFASCPREVRDDYDAVLFYTMMKDGPVDDGLPGYAGKPLRALSHLGERSQGIFLLHHSLMAYPAWPQWDEMTGIEQRDQFEYHMEQPVVVEIVRPHPVTEGLTPWQMVDETYVMKEPDAGSDVLLATESERSMYALAWTRQYRRSRVFVYQSGHDDQAWSNPAFQQVVRRGLLWCADRL